MFGKIGTKQGSGSEETSWNTPDFCFNMDKKKKFRLACDTPVE